MTTSRKTAKARKVHETTKKAFVQNQKRSNPLINEFQGAMANFFSRNLLGRLNTGLGPDGEGRDLDKEFGYCKTEPSVDLYRRYYDRFGLAKRAVQVFPNECWSIFPFLFETEKNRDTRFEKAWKELLDNPDVSPWRYMWLVDQLCGIGGFGGILFGFDDLVGDEELDKPVPGINEKGEITDKRNPGETPRKLLYSCVFAEDLIRIGDINQDSSSPRYLKPEFYYIKFSESFDNATAPVYEEKEVHWTRFLHVADNAESSKIRGQPRLKPIINYMFDARKVLGGSAEMHYKGAFPGYAIKSLPELVGDSKLDADSVNEEMDDYMAGLRRWITLEGVDVQSLYPQPGDPTAHMIQILQAICASLEVPVRIFLGAEAGHLASTQDSSTWNRRLARRQREFIEPWIIRSYVNRLMDVGVLPRVNKYIIEWRDLNSTSDAERADYAVKISQALMQYIQSKAFVLIKPKRYMMKYLKMSNEEATVIIDEAGGEEALIKTLIETADSMNQPAGATKDPAKKRNGLGA